MFNIGPEKLAVLLGIALIVLGPDRLPQAAKTLGRMLAEFRRVTGAIQSEVDEVLREPRQMVQEAMREPREMLSSARDTLNSHVASFNEDHPAVVGEGEATGNSAVGPDTEPAGWAPDPAKPAVSSASSAQTLPAPPDDPSLN